MKQYQKYLSLLLVLVAFNSNALQCGAGQVEVEGVCVSSCKILEGTGKNLTWDAYIWGDNPRSYCIGDRSTGAACKMSASAVSISVEGGKWTNKFVYTGSTCNFDEINRYSGDTPEPFPFENDVNHNGVDDKFEDWDGDGLANHEDPNPYKNDIQIVDTDGNGLPDSIDDYYDRLTNQEPIQSCNDGDEDCVNYKSIMRNLNANNKTLSSAIRDLSLRTVRRTDFVTSIGGLVSETNKNNGYFRSQLEALAQAQGNTQSSISDQLNRTEQFLANRTNDTSFTLIKKVDDVQASVNHLTNIARGTDSKVNDLINASSRDQHYFERAENANTDILSGISAILDDRYSGRSTLTSTQESQLKKAATKAYYNNKLLKELPDTLSDKLNPKFNAISEQIAAISGGSSTVDLSSVESGIQSLSDKIDALDGSDMSGVESKLTDLINGVTNNNNFVEPNYGFNGEGFIVTQNQIADVQNEVLEIKQEMTDEFEKFKALFSIDTSSFNNGTYKEHTLNLNVNHAERSFKSGVLSALLENATIISAVVMFLFVLSGIRMLGKD